MLPAVQHYHAMTEGMLRATGSTDKALHVHIGLAIFCLSSLLLRRPLRSWVPISIVALAEVANEVADRLFWGSWRWSDTLPDVAYSLFWPVALLLVLRLQKR
jgi:hypothetical protein